MTDFAGRWLTTFGLMDLSQTGTKVEGTYRMQGGSECTLEGEIVDGTLRFRYCEPTAAGEGWFVLERHGKFSGKWRPDGAPAWMPWQGERGFHGLWDSTFGPLRLIQEPAQVHGFYEVTGSATIEGSLQGKRLEFQYQEPKARGEGWFELNDDGLRFQGEWRQEEGVWAPWVGRRILPRQNLMWLVVIEAHWQSHLGERDYAFGNMLREFFARVPDLEVRQRFFTNEAGLEKWCREVLYLAEPAAVVLASHGTEDGLAAHGETVSPRALINPLRYADNVCLLHFSSCLMMQDGKAGSFMRALQDQLSFPISGYATSVDWAASALIEFTYLDMILARGLTPRTAAEQVVKLIAFAGDEQLADSPYRPAQFRFWLPEQRKTPLPAASVQ